MSLKSKLPKWLVATLFGTGLMHAALVTVVQHNEGYSERAYQDGAGVWTICYGETKGVTASQTHSKAQCDAQLQASLGEHAVALVGLPEGLPDVAVLGALDMAYNIGVEGFASSTAKARLAQKDYRGAADAVLRWKYITVNGQKFDCSTFGNTLCYGLWKRRLWQASAIRGDYKTVQEALAALPK